MHLAGKMSANCCCVLNGSEGVFDDYGFAVMDETVDQGVDGMRHTYSSQVKWSPGVCAKWRDVITECGSSVTDTKLKECRQLVRTGGYNQIRGDIWRVFLAISETKAMNTFDYDGHLSNLCTLLKKYGITEMSCDKNIHRISDHLLEMSEDNEDRKWLTTSRQIMLDIIRTFPTHRLYIGETMEKASLFRVLSIYSQFNTSVGYCQGMAYVAALLLMHISNEQDVFWAIVTLFDSDKYLAGFYDEQLSRMQTCAEIFTVMLKDRHIQLAHHLESLSIHPLMYLTSWFMCLFTTLPCWDTVLTICDLVLLEGYQCLFRVALAILEVCSAELLAMDQIEAILPFIQNLPSRLASYQVLIPVLWRTPLTKLEVENYQRSVIHDSVPPAVKPPPEYVFKTPSKRRKLSTVNSTPATRSFLGRIMTALTPLSVSSVVAAKPIATFNTTPARGAQADRRKRNREASDISAPPSRDCAVEMKLLSRKRRRSSSPLEECPSPFLSPSLPVSPFFFSPTTDGSAAALVCETPSSRLASSPSLKASPVVVRRSKRVAKRKKFQKSAVNSCILPLSSVSSPMRQPLQDKLNTSECSSAERAAFKSFATAIPVTATLN